MAPGQAPRSTSTRAARQRRVADSLHDPLETGLRAIDGLLTVTRNSQGYVLILKRNLHHVQRGQGFNSPGKLDTPEAALEELLYRLTAAGRQWLQSRQKG